MEPATDRSGGAAYVAEMATVLPPLVDACELADLLFPHERAGGDVNRLAVDLSHSFGIEQRPCTLDLARLPEMALCSEDHTPANWGARIVEPLLGDIGRDEIGYLGVSYNITSHQDTLPNLAAQIAINAGLSLDEPPHEYRSYGCASGVYSLETAADYCRSHDRAAIVFCFDQCFWGMSWEIDPLDPNFQKIVRTNLLFGDAGVGLLLVPERLRARFEKPLPKILAVRKSFQAGDLIRMQNGKFMVEKEIRHIVPKMVSDALVKPAMADLGITRDDVVEWSIHQGGHAILNGLCEPANLGLSEEQVGRSRAFFQRYGNLSSPSCLMVLDSFFHEPESATKKGERGLVVGFGAGYYMGLMLYQWSAPPAPH
jgi:predicted naringenin-chalcone synthase